MALTIDKQKEPADSARLIVLIYMLFGFIGTVSIFFGVYLVIEGSIEFADGTRRLQFPGATTILRFGWPFAMGLGIWLAGAAIQWLLSGVRAFPLRWGRVPIESPPPPDDGGGYSGEPRF